MDKEAALFASPARASGAVLNMLWDVWMGILICVHVSHVVRQVEQISITFAPTIIACLALQGVCFDYVGGWRCIFIIWPAASLSIMNPGTTNLRSKSRLSAPRAFVFVVMWTEFAPRVVAALLVGAWSVLRGGARGPAA